MEEAYRQYLEKLYSSSPWSEFIGFYEPTNSALDAHNLVRGPGGFGKIATSPNLMIYQDNPQERILEWMGCCLTTAGIQDNCYVWIRSGPWAEIKILDRSKWLNSIWGMQYPQTPDTVVTLLIMSADQSQVIYFAERGEVVDVHIGNLSV